jgi:hypothetical protein
MYKCILYSKILDSCGWIVGLGNTRQLTKTIQGEFTQYVLDHPAEAKEKGLKAREKCKKKYS